MKYRIVTTGTGKNVIYHPQQKSFISWNPCTYSTRDTLYMISMVKTCFTREGAEKFLKRKVDLDIWSKDQKVTKATPYPANKEIL